MSHWTNPSRIDRLDRLRGNPAALDELAAASVARLIHLGDDLSIPLSDGVLAAQPMTEPRRPDDLLLGRLDGHIWWARRDGEAGSNLRYLDLPDDQVQLAMMATALFEWHDLNPTCGRCGAATAPARGGAIRVCQACATELFPRTDPAVIVAVTDAKDRLLLTHNAAWATGRVSIQAGFVEAGESAEQACYREIAEETGLQIASLRFSCSQPWPFPRSLMLGFEATVTSADVRVDGEELTWGRFFTRAEFHQAVADEQILLPGAISLARQLIGQWVARG